MTLLYISVGSNTRREHYISSAYQALTQHFKQLRCSQVYESESIGFCGDSFYNLVIEARTELTLEQTIDVLKQIEDQHDRVRDGIKFSGRTLDLDLLLFGNLVCQQPVILPRPEITENAFVLLPLSELAPTVQHPALNIDFASLWRQYNKPQKLWPVDYRAEQLPSQSALEY